MYISGDVIENGFQNVQKYSHWMLYPRQRRPISVDDAPLAEALLSVESPESFDNNNSGVFLCSLGSSSSSPACCETESGMVSNKVSLTPSVSTLSQAPKRKLFSSHEGLYFFTERFNSLIFCDSCEIGDCIHGGKKVYTSLPDVAVE